MPLYEYECLECGTQFEKMQKFGAEPPKTCPHGHSEVHRLFSKPAIIFKGSGFYVTDNKGKARNPASRNGSKPEKKESEAKSEDKAETKAGTEDKGSE